MIPLSIVRIAYYTHQENEKAQIGFTVPKEVFKTKESVETGASKYILQHIATTVQEYIDHKYHAVMTAFECTLDQCTMIQDCATMEDDYPDEDTKQFWQSRWFVHYDVTLSKRTNHECYAIAKKYAQKSTSIGAFLGLASKPLNIDEQATIVFL